MTLWVNRAGRHGEYEHRFLRDSRIYLTWDGLSRDLSKLSSKSELSELLREVYPEFTKGRIGNYTGQIWQFAKEMHQGDWVVLPGKMKKVICVGEITGPYVFDPKEEDPYYHHHTVRWLATDIPRSSFDQDLLYSFGVKTVCCVHRNNAEQRVREMGARGWKSVGRRKATVPATPEKAESEEKEPAPDLEEAGRDQIAELIQAKFKGHGMARLVNAILQAQGYTTRLSPEGPDKGVDILAGTGPMGFGQPRLCVQVKSGDSPLDRPTLDQLIGTMQNVQADQGLLVSWGGFKVTVDREIASQFFRVRLWDQAELIEHLLENYEKLDDDVRAELPLKRIWTVAAQNEED